MTWERMKHLNKEQNFETAMQELEKIVQQLEKGDLPLETALDAFKQGIELSNFCQKTLLEAEETVAKMMTQDGLELLDGDQGWNN